MKKKNKIIWGAITAVSIGSLVVGSSLACVQFNASKKDDNATKTSTKNITNLSASDDNVNTSNNISFNNHAYMQTLNQSITTNPQGSSWTKQDALMFTNSKINDLVNIYGVTYVLRWNLIQNLNYSLSQYISSISQQQFSISITNFNYNIMNAKNNDNLKNYSCSITLNVQFKVTSKTDGATLTFSNTYTYNDVVINTNIINNGQNAYAYLVLTNSLANTLVPNNVSYCNNAKISSNWTNNDFVNLQTINWLPINSNTTITTANYQGMLADSCARSFNNGTNQTYTQQTKFINLINSQQLYTFNIGFNFGQLNDVVIEVQGQKPNNNGLYTFNYNDQVTLEVNFVDSTIISGGGNVYQWMRASVSSTNSTGITIANANANTYQFSCYKSYKYYLQVTLPDGKTLTSNTITIDVNTSSLAIENLSPNANSSSNIYTAQYGSTVTLSANAAWQNITNVNYTWEQYNNSTQKFEPIQSAPNASTYRVTAINNEVYKLVITAISGDFSITSDNSYTINIQNSSITINAINANNQPFSNANEIPYGSTVNLVLQNASAWQNVPGLTYTWYQVISATSSESVQSTQQYEPYKINSLISGATYELKITNPNNPSFVAVAASINLGISDTQLAINLTQNSLLDSNVTKTTNGSFDVIYGTTVTLQVTSSYWSNLDNHNYVYQWYKYTENAATSTWSFQPITGANGKTYTPSINSLAGIYRLQIANSTNPNFDLSPSNEITIIVKQKDCTIQTNITNYANSIAYGQSLTLSLEQGSYWDIHNENLVFTWYKQNGDVKTKLVSSSNSSYIISNAKASNDGTYYLVITNKNIPDFSITSNSIIVKVGAPKLTIDLKKSTQSQHSYQLQDTYQQDYGQQVTLQINSVNSSNNINNVSNSFQWQWGSIINNQFTVIGQTSFGSYQVLNKYALFLSNLYPNQPKIGISYRLVMSDDGGKNVTATSNTITILPNSNSSYLQLYLGGSYNTNQDYQITYGNSATISIYGYWQNNPLNLSLNYQWTDVTNNKQVGTNSPTLPVSYLVANATYDLTITCPSIPGFKLTSQVIISPTSNVLALNVKGTFGYINSDNLNQNALTATYGTYLCFNVLNLNSYELYDSFQYEWEYATYLNGRIKWNQITNTKNTNYDYYAFIATQNIQLKLVITSSKQPDFNLTTNEFSISVVNTNASINVFKGLNNWSANPSTNNMIANNEGNDYFLNYAHAYTLGLTDYWNNPNTNSSDGFNELYDGGLTYTWTSHGEVIAQTNSSVNPASFNPWYQIPSFATSTIYTLTISGKVKSQLPNNFPQPENLDTFNELNLAASVILNVQSNTISIGAIIPTNGPVTMVNNGTFNVVYGYTPSVQVETKYFIQNKEDYTFKWLLNDNPTAYKSGVGLTQIKLPDPILANGTTIQLIIEPLQGGKSIASQIITLNPIDVNVSISGYAGANNSANASSTQVNANYSENTYLAPTPSTSQNQNFWANSDAKQYFPGLVYTWYQVNTDGTLDSIGDNESASTPTLLLNPTQVESQYTLIITDPSISSNFKITSTTNITVNVSNYFIEIKATSYKPKYGDAVTLSLTNPYWTNVSYQWYYNSVATGNEVLNNSTNGINGNTSTSKQYEFYAEKTATYVLQIKWTENGKEYSLTSNSITINVQDDTLLLTGSGINPDESAVNFPTVNGLNEYVVNCWYGASNLSFTPTGYWASAPGASYQWQESSNNGNTWTNITSANGGTKETYNLPFIFSQNTLYRLVVTCNNLSITSGTIIFNLSNQNVSINATHENQTSTSSSDAINVPFGASFTLSVTGAWANSNISSGYIYTWYYGTNPTNSNHTGIEIGTGPTISILQSTTSYNGSSTLPTENSTYSYYCIITNQSWNANQQVNATTTPTVNIVDVTPQLAVQSVVGSNNTTLNPQDGTNQYLTNYGENIELNISNYGYTTTNQSLNWSYGSITGIKWYVELNNNSYQLNSTNASTSFYSLTNGISYYAVITGLLNGISFTIKSQSVAFSLQQTSLALSVTSGSTSASNVSNSIVSGTDKSTAYIVKYGSMQIITPTQYWINYFTANSNLAPTYTWLFDNGNGSSPISLTNNLNTTSNQYQYAQFFTNGMDGGANEGSYQLSVKFATISQQIPTNDGNSKTVYFDIGTQQPIVIEVVGETLAISATGDKVSLDSGNAYSYVYGSEASVTINDNKVNWANPTFLTNNSSSAPSNNNITLTYTWSYGSAFDDLTPVNNLNNSNSYVLNGSSGFYQLDIVAVNSATNTQIFKLTSNIVHVTVSNNTIAIANNAGEVSGTYDYEFGENTPLQLDPSNYWAKNTTGNSYQWYCSTSPTWDANNIYLASNPNGTIFALNESPFDASSTPASNIWNSTNNSGSLYGPNNLNLYGSGDGQSIKCNPCYAIKNKIYYWLQLTNSNWASGTPAIISNPIVINPVMNTVTIGSYSTTSSSSNTDWYNSTNIYSWNYGDKVMMSIYDKKTSLPAGVTYNWQVYTGDTIYTYTNTTDSSDVTYYYNESGFYDITTGQTSSAQSTGTISTSDYDTNPTDSSYWLNVLTSGNVYRLKVTINHVSVYSNPIALNVSQTSSNVSLQNTGVSFVQQNLADNKKISTTNNLTVAIGTSSTVQLIPDQFWSNVFNNTTGTGPYSRSYYNWTVNWTNNLVNYGADTYFGTYSSSFQLDSKGSLSNWNISWVEQYNPYPNTYQTKSPESISWDNGTITLPQVLSSFSFTLTITPKTSCIQYTPFETYWPFNAIQSTTPTSTSFSLTSNTVTVKAIGSYIGLEGKSLTDYSLDNFNSTNSYNSTAVFVPYLADLELAIPSVAITSNSNLDSNQTANWWWINEIENNGEVDGKKLYDLSLCEVTYSYGNSSETTTTYTPIYNLVANKASNWTSQITKNQNYAIEVNVLNSTGTVVNTFYSSVLTINCFANNSSIVMTPKGISATSVQNTYTMSYLQLIDNPIEFEITNNWTYFKGSNYITEIKTLVYKLGESTPVSITNGDWLTANDTSTLINPFVPIDEGGQYYVEIEFYNGTNLVQTLTNKTNPITINTTFNDQAKTNANDSFSINSAITQGTNTFDTQIANNSNNEYSYDFNSFVNWQTGIFANNTTNSSNNANPYALVRTITPADLANESYYGGYFVDASGSKLVVPANSTSLLDTAINFAIQYEPSGSTTWTTYGKAVTFAASLLPSGSDYWNVITNYWLMQNANKTGELATGINGFNPFAWTLGNQNYQWRVQASVALNYDGNNYSFDSSSAGSTSLANQFVFTSPSWQFDENSTNLAINLQDATGNTFNPITNGSTPIYTLNGSDKYSVKFSSTPNISWNDAISDKVINNYSDSSTMYLTSPILLSVQVMFEAVGASSFSPTVYSWTNPDGSTDNLYAIYQSLFNSWKNSTLNNYSVNDVLTHLNNLSFNEGFYKVQFTLLNASNTWIMNAQNNIDSSKWTFSNLDTATFSTNPIYIMTNTNAMSSTNIVTNPLNETNSLNWLNIAK